MAWGLLIGCILLCEFAGSLGAIFNFQSLSGWYKKLKKPSINPPNWIFGPVWTSLYFLMGVSLYLILNQSSQMNFPAILMFSFQLLLNVLWSGIFFFLKKPKYAFFEVVLLWFAIIYTIFLFYPLSRLASLLLIPYLAWVSFASILNFLIWRLNKN